MVVVTVFGVFLLAVLLVGAFAGLMLYDEYKQLQSKEIKQPVLELKRRFDLGQIDRQQFEDELRAEIESHESHTPRKAV